MRAVYLKDLKNKIENNQTIYLDDIHHLINVVKIKTGEEILLLNGAGLSVLTQIQEITKKNIGLKIIEQKITSPIFDINLAQCLVKKEAMEDILRMSVEVGISNIFPLQSQYSWHQFIPQSRIDAILCSALEQSNNPNLPKMRGLSKILEFNFKDFDHVLYFTSNPEAPSKQNLIRKGKILLLIGPEGGLSSTEEEYLFSQDNFSFYHFPTPILRAPTAALVATGYTLSKLT